MPKSIATRAAKIRLSLLPLAFLLLFCALGSTRPVWAQSLYEEVEEYRPLDLDEEEDGSDRSPPVIHHDVRRVLIRGEHEFRVRITDDSEVPIATFYWRFVGRSRYRAMPLLPSLGEYSVRLKLDSSIEYWIEAFDEHGNGPALHGSASEPHRITVVDEELVGAIDEHTVEVPKKVWVHQPLREISSLLGVSTAAKLPAGTLELRGSGSFYAASDYLLPNALIAGGQGQVRAALGLADWLEINLSTEGRGLSMYPEASELAMQSYSSIGSTLLGLRYVSPPLQNFQLAGELDLKFHNPIGGTGWSASPRLRAAASWRQDYLRLHAQLGMLWDNSSALLNSRWPSLLPQGVGLSRYDWLFFGLAAELPFSLFGESFRSFSAIAAYRLELPFDRRHFAACEQAPCPDNPPWVPTAYWQIPQSLGIGARWQILHELSVDLGIDLSLSRLGRGLEESGRYAPLEGFSPSPPWTLHAQLQWLFDVAPVGTWFAGLIAPKMAASLSHELDSSLLPAPGHSTDKARPSDPGHSSPGHSEPAIEVFFESGAVPAPNPEKEKAIDPVAGPAFEAAEDGEPASDYAPDSAPPDSELESETDFKSGSASGSEAESDSGSESNSGSESGAESKTYDSESDSGSGSGSGSDSGSESSGSESDSSFDFEPDFEPDSGTPSGTDSESGLDTRSESESGSESDSESRSESRSESESDSKPESEPEPDLGFESGSDSDFETDSETDSEPAPQHSPKTQEHFDGSSDLEPASSPSSSSAGSPRSSPWSFHDISDKIDDPQGHGPLAANARQGIAGLWLKNRELFQ